MTPKENTMNYHHHDGEDSADDSWREETNKAADAADALRNYGLLPPRASSSVSATRLVCQTTTTTIGSWYCSSSDDEDDDDSFGDGSDNEDNYCDDNTNNPQKSNNCTKRSRCCGLRVEYETELVVGFRGSLYGLGNSSNDSYTSFYGIGYSLPGEEDDDEQEQDEAKFQEDERVFQSNLRRRSIRFVEHPQVQEYEPAPFNLHCDLYYSCHQLQKMMDEHNAEQQQEPQPGGSGDLPAAPAAVVADA